MIHNGAMTIGKDAYLDMLVRIDGKVDKLSDEQGKFTKQIGELKCGIHSEKIGRLEKVVYGVIGVILLGWIVSINTNSNTATAKIQDNIPDNLQSKIQVVQPLKGK